MISKSIVMNNNESLTVLTFRILRLECSFALSNYKKQGTFYVISYDGRSYDERAL